MATIFNGQRKLGIRIVPDGTKMYLGRPVIGVREAAAGVLFVDNKRVLGVDVLSADQKIYNEQPVVGAVLITDSRTIYNGQRVIPTNGGSNTPAWQIIQSILSPANEDYAYFDFTDTDRRFVENTGSTPAANAGDSVGLSVDRSKQSNKTLKEVVDAMPEKVLNGGFDSGANWSMTSTSTISGGKLHMNAEAAGGNVLQTGNGYVVGKLYAITYEVSNYVSGQHRVQIEAAVGQTRTGNGVFTDYIQCINANARTFIRSVSTLTCDVDNISIKEVPAHYASQATNTFKPAVQASGIKFDGSDDTLLTDWLANVGGDNFIMAQVGVQSAFNGFDPFLYGGQDGVPNRLAIGVQYTTGFVRVSAGQGAAYVGTSDVRGVDAVIAASVGAGLVDVMVNGAIEKSQAFSGAVYGGPNIIGGLNNNGSTINRWGGSLKRLLLGKRRVGLDDYNRIRAAWLAQG